MNVRKQLRGLVLLTCLVSALSLGAPAFATAEDTPTGTEPTLIAMAGSISTTSVVDFRGRMYEMSQPEYGYSAKVSVDQFANSVNASNPGIYEIPLVHTDAKGRLWTTNQGSEEQLHMLDGVKLAPNKAYGSYTGSASLLITDKDGLLAMISGLSRISTGAANSKTLGSSLSNKNAPATPPNAPMVT